MPQTKEGVASPSPEKPQPEESPPKGSSQLRQMIREKLFLSETLSLARRAQREK